ncbi:hypothetical protein DPMN_123150 [Dreissena polymorpha]|uniref:Uncharacterized protein n=1 Tax=Dreissena polymorpha TaxID=45954 RepID=A0A9D4GPT5_DREPO|nr:hypothetical protein DPMN_123150 [Dreissena polymorpha]
MLGTELEGNGYRCVHTVHDSDRLIVETSLKLVETSNVTIIGEDTDLLVLLLHYNTPSKSVFFKSATSATASKAELQIRFCEILKLLPDFQKEFLTLKFHS